MRQVTKEEAIKIYESGLWQDWTHEERVKFQLYQSKLTMPFDVFHEAVTIVLGRSVYTHEFAGQEGKSALQSEFEGKRPAPTFDEILAMIPGDKIIIQP